MGSLSLSSPPPLPYSTRFLISQDQICHFLKILREERENILWYKRENEKETQDLLETVQAGSEKPATTFSQLGQFLEEKKKLWQAQMLEVGKEIVGKRDEYQSTLFEELSSLGSLIQELGEKQQLSADELPQNLGDILERCKRKSFLTTEAFPGTLKRKIRDLPKLNSFLEAIMKRFQDTLVFRLQFQKGTFNCGIGWRTKILKGVELRPCPEVGFFFGAMNGLIGKEGGTNSMLISNFVFF
ncbi:hypothetical protein lerEdw1_003613 [Lerista edwardsae]|nr:hypothetical protein lerEdw1_003613 [Lerista edwardsae]